MPKRTLISKGQKFNRLTAKNFSHRTEYRDFWVFSCECGKTKTILLTKVTSGKTRSCGCLVAEKARENFSTHQKSKTAEYRAWAKIKERCYSDCRENIAKYYKSIGITMCRKWRDSFENFLEDMGQRPSPKHSIDRIDVNGNYEPGNCRWATLEQQANNKRRTIFVEVNGEKMPLMNILKPMQLYVQEILTILHLAP
jgi:hypothetical protein